MTETVDAWLTRILDREGINEAELAKRGGFKQSVLSNAKDRNSIGPDIARKIADAIRRSQHEVFYELGLITERPGQLIIKDPILADIWSILGKMDNSEKSAVRMMLKRMVTRDELKAMFGEGKSASPNPTEIAHFLESLSDKEYEKTVALIEAKSKRRKKQQVTEG